MIKEGSYFIGWSWVMTDLGLSGNEAIIYMVINGFSRKGRSWFTGSAGYLAEVSNCSRATVMRILKKLTSQGLLKKQTAAKNGATFCNYQTVVPEHIRERYGYMEEEAEATAKKEARAECKVTETTEEAQEQSMESKGLEAVASTDGTDWNGFLRLHGVAKPVPPSMRLELVARYEAFKQRLKAGMRCSPPMGVGLL